MDNKNIQAINISNETINELLPLGELGGLWERNRVRYTLDACLAEVRDRTQDIEAVIAECRKKDVEETLQLLAGEELTMAACDRLKVPEYIQRERAKQHVYAFLNTHWETVPMQVFYDYCKAGVKKMGFSNRYAENQKFMNPVFENVQFRVMQNIRTVQPIGGVWINLRNGTLEIRQRGTVLFRSHRAEDFFTYCLPYAYDPKARCPMWHGFLDEVMPDKDMQTLLGEYIGYCFTKNLKLEKMAVFYGSGANGKSVLMDVLCNLFGKNNVSQSTLSSITTDPEARTQLQDKLVNISSESNRNIDSSILKMMVSGEPVEMRLLYVGTRLLEDPPKLITSYNELPPMENTYGYRRRWLLFPFNVTIPEERQDPDLARKLCSELPGILNWVLGCLSALIQRVMGNSGGFTTSEKCATAMSDYSRSSNSVLMFLDECCTKDDSSTVRVKEAYAEYAAYCHASGITKPFTQKNFKKFAVEWGAEIFLHEHLQYINIKVNGEA